MTTTVTQLVSDGGRAEMARPVKIGHYSVDYDTRVNRMRFRNNDSALVYFHKPADSSVTFDLLDGYDPAINWTTKRQDDAVDYHDGGQDSMNETGFGILLQWISANRTLPLDVDFVANRWIFKQLMTTPYSGGNLHQIRHFKLRASKFLGSIYMDSDSRENDHSNRDVAYWNKLTFSGYRFESFLTSPYRDQAPDVEQTTTLNQENNQFKCVVQSRIYNIFGDTNSFILPAEVDGASPNGGEEKAMQKYIEIKTVKYPYNNYNYNSLAAFIRKRYSISWWAQNYLAGIEKIFCGFRNEDFKINHTEMFKTRELAELSRDFWSKKECLNFLCNFLSLVKDTVVEDDPLVVYEFTFSGERIDFERIDVSESNKRVVPEWFERRSHRDSTVNLVSG